MGAGASALIGLRGLVTIGQLGLKTFQFGSYAEDAGLLNLQPYRLRCGLGRPGDTSRAEAHQEKIYQIPFHALQPP